MLYEVITQDGGRRVNLDPGLLSLANLILATTKNRSHRIPLFDGIYAELTLLYAKKQFHRITSYNVCYPKLLRLFAIWWT